jgi:hypothetical protein
VKTYRYEIEGLDRYGQTWKAAGLVTAAMRAAANAAITESFRSLAEGKAGDPENRCIGPYRINRILIELT